MHSVSTNMTVIDFCDGLKRRDIAVNRDYQRSDQVWPDSARSYLIESLVLGYPLPKIYLYQITDIKSRKTVKEIVDGQQRSIAIDDFLNDKFALSKSTETEELQGRKYSELEDEHKHAFLQYPLSFDLLVDANKENIVEVFRRINSYTVPLNPEEHRHATFQGRFKWFANRLSRGYNGLFRELGIFSEKQLIRMADTKLLTELSDALLNGVRTTNKKILDKLYKDNDKGFYQEKAVASALKTAFDLLSRWESIQGTNLMKPYIVYSLVLAIIALKESFEALDSIKLPKKHIRPDQRVLANLLRLSDALNYDVEEAPEEFRPFVLACNGGTNVKDKRINRVKWLARALVEDEL
jgi:hypothetical protein